MQNPKKLVHDLLHKHKDEEQRPSAAMAVTIPKTMKAAQLVKVCGQSHLGVGKISAEGSLNPL
jgi:hypothetical protein